jgi:nitrite reductase/ring-hydroxylating ferredoxin subunit
MGADHSTYTLPVAICFGVVVGLFMGRTLARNEGHAASPDVAANPQSSALECMPPDSSHLNQAAATSGGSTFCGLKSVNTTDQPPTKTARQYTTAVILPSLAWIKTGIKSSELAPTELRAFNLGGTDVLIGKSESGKIFSVANLCPHLGTPMSEGADVIGDTIVCPLHSSSWNVFSGELLDWCTSPPIIGPLTGIVIEKKMITLF